jgi:cation:H+ antiporter
MHQLLDIVLIAVSVFFLIQGTEWITTAAVIIAEKLGVSKLAIASTLIALGTGLPSIAVNVAFVLLNEGGSDTAMGVTLGTNFVNIGLGLGIPAILISLKMKYQVFEKEIPILLGICALFTSFLIDGVFSRFEGVVLLIIYAVVLFIIFQYANRERLEEKDKKQVELDTSTLTHTPTKKVSYIGTYINLFLGILSIVLSSLLIAYITPSVSNDFNISEYILGITLIGIGTSIPMIVTSIKSALKGYVDIIIGNVFGSTIANIVLGIGFVAILKPLTVSAESLEDMYYFNVLNIVVILSLLIETKVFGGNKILSRLAGVVIVISYLCYLATKFL